MKNDIIIRNMEKRDIDAFPIAFAQQGWNKPQEQFERYFAEQEQNKRQVFVAEIDGMVAGYLTLLPQAGGGAFCNNGIPEICDFNVLMKFQKQGIGSALMEHAEKQAELSSEFVCLGVGLHKGYGSAQRMYVKRGYIPDGSGVWYRDKQLDEYADCRNDDDLVLYLMKKL